MQQCQLKNQVRLDAIQYSGINYLDQYFRENITKDLYIYLEEAEGLRRFEFWPHSYIDIEKPSSVSEDREFIWRVPLHLDRKIHGSYVKNYEVRVDIAEVYIVHIQVHYPFHFRYQSAQNERQFTNVSFPNPQVYIDCENTQLKLYSENSSKFHLWTDQINESNGPDYIPSDLIPNGIKEEFQQIQILTLGSTFLGLVYISLSMVAKSFDKLYKA